MKQYRITFIITLMGIILFLAFYPSTAISQWVEQTIILKPGWNAVYLELNPRPNRCDEIFQNVPIASIWTRNPQVETIQRIQNPDTLSHEQPEWLVYFPAFSPQSMLTNLHILLGRRAYLINLRGETEVEVTITGRPCLPKIAWKPNSFNFVGFHLLSGHEPFFSSFFSASSAHQGQAMYRLNANDEWEKIEYPAATPMKAGEAYWVYCRGHSDYVGPVVCKIEIGNSLMFGKVPLAQTLHLHNLSSQNNELSLRALCSKNPVDESQPPVVGEVPLLYLSIEPEHNKIWWYPLPNTLSVSLGSKKEKTVRLAVKRSDMAPAGLSQSILEVTNDKGMRVLIPVSAEGLAKENTGQTRQRNGDGFTLDSSQHTGLWVGTALIERVSHPVECCRPDPNNISCMSVDCCPLIGPVPPEYATCCPGEAGGRSCDMDEDYWTTPTDSTFQFRLIMHFGKKETVDDQGNQVAAFDEVKARLLREVIQMWNKSTYELVSDPVYPDDLGPIEVIKDPGNYVLLTDDSLISIPKYDGTALQIGKLVGRRISSAAFGFQKVSKEETQDDGVTVITQKVREEPVDMQLGTSSQANTVLTCSVKTKPDDPLNPYYHKYHPDHDNLNPEGKSPLNAEDEPIHDAYEITRNIKLEFTATDPAVTEDSPEGAGSLGWGVTDIGGIYWERISGLHKHKIFIKGIFRLYRVSGVDRLTYPAE